MTRTPQCQVCVAIQDPGHFIRPQLQIHLPSSHNDQRALPLATHHVFAHMVLSTWNEASSLAISTFRSLTQLPRFRSKATSCGKPFSDPFLMHVPPPVPSYSNHLLAHLLLHWSLNQFHFQACSLQASLPHRRQVVGRHRPGHNQLPTPHLAQRLGHHRRSVRGVLKRN